MNCNLTTPHCKGAMGVIKGFVLQSFVSYPFGPGSRVKQSLPVEVHDHQTCFSADCAT